MVLHPLHNKSFRFLSTLVAVGLAIGLLAVLGVGLSQVNASSAATGIWEPTGGPIASGGQVNALVVQRAFSGTAYLPGGTLSDTLYALVGVPGSGSDTKVYKSIDGAESWTPVYTATSDSLRAVDVAGQTVYVAGQCGGSRDCIRKSVNGGMSWTTVYAGADEYAFYAIAINPVTTSTVYAAGHMNGNGWSGNVVYATTNGGVSWTQVLSVTAGGGNDAFLTLAVNPVTPTTVFAAGSYNNNGVIYRSIDSGDHWTQVYTATDIGAWMPVQQVNAMLVHPLTPTIIYAGTGWGPNVVYRSTDGGDTWNLVNENTHWAGFGLAFQAPDSVYAIADWGEVSLSTMGGISGTWSSVGNINDQGPVIASGHSALYAGGRAAGVVKSVDGGVSWTPANTGIQSLVGPRTIAIDSHNPARIFVGTSASGGWRTINSGATWAKPAGPDWDSTSHWPDQMRFTMNQDNPNIVYLGINSCHEGNVLRSSNGGLTFTAVYTSAVITPPNCSGDEQINAIAIAPSLTSTVYAAGWDHLWSDNAQYAIAVRSVNDGASWTEVFTLPLNSTVEVLAINPQDARVIYAGGQDCSGPCTGFVYRSLDGGNLWSKILTPTQTTRSIVIDPQKPDVLYVGGDDYRVYKSTDGGDTWSVVRRPPWESGGPSGSLLAIDPKVPSHVYLGGWGYIAETVDGGVTWGNGGDPIGQGTPPSDPQALAVSTFGVSQTLYAGFSGLWRYERLAPQPGPALTLTLSSSVLTITAGGAITFTSLGVDQFENWLADGTVVTFTSPGFFITTTAQVNAGYAAASLTALKPGAAIVTASTGAASATIAITIQPHRVFLPIVVR